MELQKKEMNKNIYRGSYKMKNEQGIRVGPCLKSGIFFSYMLISPC